MLNEAITNNFNDKIKNYTNTEILDLIHYLSYTSVTDKNAKPTKLQSEFIENFFTKHMFEQHISDVLEPKYFTHCSMTDRTLISHINSLLHIECYFRLRKLVDINEKNALETKVIKLENEINEIDNRMLELKNCDTVTITIKKENVKLLSDVINDCVRNNNELIQDEQTTRQMFDNTEANELIAERHVLSDVFTNILKQL